MEPSAAAALRAYVTQRVTEFEGLQDDILIDMVLRRVRDPDADKVSLEASLSVLMGSRAAEFTDGLWRYLEGREPRPEPLPPREQPKASTQAGAGDRVMTNDNYYGSGSESDEEGHYEEEEGSSSEGYEGDSYGEEEEEEEEEGEDEYQYGDADPRLRRPDEAEEDNGAGVGLPKQKREWERALDLKPKSDDGGPLSGDGDVPVGLPPEPMPGNPFDRPADGSSGRGVGGDEGLTPGSINPSAPVGPRPGSSAEVYRPDLMASTLAGQVAGLDLAAADGDGAGCDGVACGGANRPTATAARGEQDASRLSRESQAAIAAASLPPPTSVAASTWAMSDSAVCAVACDGIEQAYLPTPLADPIMEEADLEQLHEWLTEAATQLYGGDADDDENAHADLVERTAAVLRNSQLTATVFAAYEAAEKEEKEQKEAKEASEDGSGSSAAALGGASSRIRLNLSALPSSLRSLLDEKSINFIGELWRVLRRDEPQTADALLNPASNETLPISGAPKCASDPLSTSRCDYLAEALGASLAASSAADAMADAGASSADGGGGSCGGVGGGGCDRALVRRWVEERVISTQGFSDQIVIDAVMRWVEGSGACAVPPPSDRQAVKPSAGGESRSRDPSALDDPSALESHLGLLLEAGGAKQLVIDLCAFLRSPASRAAADGLPGGLTGSAAGKPSAPQPAQPSAVGIASLPADVRRWCEGDLGVWKVLLLTEVPEGVLLILRSPSGDGAALVQKQGSRGLTPLPDLPPGALSTLVAAWPAPSAALVQLGTRLVMLHGSGHMSSVVELPPHVTSLSAAWERATGLVVAAIVQTHDADASSASASIAVWPSPPPKRELRRFTMGSGWLRLGDVGPAAARLAISSDGQRAVWCEFSLREDTSGARQSVPYVPCGQGSTGPQRPGGGGDSDDLECSCAVVCGSRAVGEIYCAELVTNMEPRPLSEGAGTCSVVSLAPDGTGVVYLATHRSTTADETVVPASSRRELSLWWQVWEGDVPPQQLSAPNVEIIGFGWAPSVEEEEDEEEDEGEERGEEDEEPLPGLRLWLTTRKHTHAVTQLIDLAGSILGAFELPVTPDGCRPESGVLWLADGRRVLITESSDWFPSLWDGAALSPLPLPAGFSQITVAENSWPSTSGRPMHSTVHAMRGTPPDAPVIVILHSELDGPPLLATRSAISTGGGPHVGLLRCGYRIISVDCSPPPEGAATTSPWATVTDALAGLQDFLESTLTVQQRRACRVGLLGIGHSAHLAIRALAHTAALKGSEAPSPREIELFTAAVCIGAHTDTSLAAYECGLPPPRAATGSPASLLSRLSRSRTPTLLLHGAQDPLHPASHSKAVYHALRAGEATTRLVLYEGEGHALRSPEHRRDANQRVCAWFRAHMPGATPPVFVH